MMAVEVYGGGRLLSFFIFALAHTNKAQTHGTSSIPSSLSSEAEAEAEAMQTSSQSSPASLIFAYSTVGLISGVRDKYASPM